MTLYGFTNQSQDEMLGDGMAPRASGGAKSPKNSP